jgi:hypothetical protein
MTLTTPLSVRPGELRDQGLLKLFFGADPAALADGQIAVHRAKLDEYNMLRAAVPADAPRAPLALEAGIAHEREWVRFWAGWRRGSEDGVPVSQRTRVGAFLGQAGEVGVRRASGMRC